MYFKYAAANLAGALTLAISTGSAAQETAARGQTAFNPEISLILQGAFISRDAGEHHITGFLPAGDHEHGGAERGFTLDHTELVMSANVDHAFRGYLNLAFLDEHAEVEEAWFQTLGLSHGFTVKGGRFLSGIGYQNELHPHAWDFSDTSLMYQALFGTHLIHDGIQAKWLAPADTFMEFGVEAARGQNFPGTEAAGDRNGAGMWAAFARMGDDVGVSNSWRAGLSFLHAKPEERHGELEDLSDQEAAIDFSGTSKTWIADFVWKWAPDGNPKYRNLKFQAEYFRRNETGELTCEDNSADGGACVGTTDAYRAKQSGWYAQAVYQFMPRWRAGYRYDRLDSGTPDFAANNASLPVPDYNPDRQSVMLDYSPSEFSRLRLQLARDQAMQGDADNVVTLQYILSLGAHGVHRF